MVGVTDRYHSYELKSRTSSAAQREHAMSKSLSNAAVLERETDKAGENVFSPYALGALTLKNRMVMAPMTRSRALDGSLPNPVAWPYYPQRASAGLSGSASTQ